MNINNVYDEVKHSFENDLDWTPISRDLAEGFLRQKAWQGMNDADLCDLWGNLKMFISYLSYSGNLTLEEITVSEYSLLIEWSNVQMDFKPTLKAVRRFFEVLEDFYTYLAGKKFAVDLSQLKKAKELMTSGKRLKFIEPPFENYNLIPFDQNQEQSPGVSRIIPEDISQMIGETVERLMLKFSSYFQQDEFADDFDRALMLYIGPEGEMPDETERDSGDDEFWLGFWDYFLFDYHLLENDLTPLEKFKSVYNDKISAEEKKILKDLMEAKFTVFYVSRIINPNWVECINLLTQDKFRLPNPNFDYKQTKKMLFFGHVFFHQCEQELVMINFITSVEVGINLRKRIKEEIEKQKTIFNIQNQEACWEVFLARHANVVRHTIYLLAGCSKVIVTHYNHIERTFPVINKEIDPLSIHPVCPEVTNLIGHYMPKFTYSCHDVFLAKKLWQDYCRLAGDIALRNIRKPAAWAAAVIYVYSQINADNVDSLALEVIGQEMKVTKSTISQNKSRLIDRLYIEKFDPRYVSEEGFLFMLYQ